MNPQLDPTIVNLAKAIRQTESGGDFAAKGKSGEHGAYQYTPTTWQTDAAKYGVNAPLEQATPQQQNEVAYKKLADLKAQGYNVGQIASIWNSGKPEWEGNVGVNKFGVKYDTPQYVNSVAKTYQAYKAGMNNAPITPTSSTVGNAGGFNPKPFSTGGGIFSIDTTGQAPAEGSQTGQEEGLGGKLKSRLSDASNALSKGAGGQINPLSSALQVGGAVGGAIGDVTSAALELIPGVKQVEGLIGKGIGALADTSAGKYVTGAWQSFAKEHPELADDIGAGFNIATAIPILKGLGLVKGIAVKGAASALTSVAEKGVAKTLTEGISKTIGGRNALKLAEGRGISPVETLVKNKWVPEVENGRYVTQNAYDAIGHSLETDEAALQKRLVAATPKQSEGLRIQGIKNVTGEGTGRVPIETLRKDALKNMADEFKAQGNVDKVQSEVNRVFDSYRASYGDSVSLQELNDMKRGIRQSVNFNSPKVEGDVSYHLGQQFMSKIEDVAKAQGLDDVRVINAIMANKITAQKVLRFLENKVAKRGMFGNALIKGASYGGMLAGEATGNAFGMPLAGTLMGRGLGSSLGKVAERSAESAGGLYGKILEKGGVKTLLTKQSAKKAAKGGSALILQNTVSGKKANQQ